MFGQRTPRNGAPVLSPRAKLEQQYRTSRGNLLLVIIMTVVSMLTLYFSDSYFYFSAYLPLSIFSEGVLYSRIAEGTYAYMSELTAEEIAYFSEISSTMFLFGLIAAVVILAVYFICWLCSKKHPTAIVVATVFFAIDCIVLLYDIPVYGFDQTTIFNILFHGLVMFYLVLGIVSWRKLKKLPPEEAAPFEVPFTVINGEPIPSAVPTEALNEAPIEHEPPSEQDQSHD